MSHTSFEDHETVRNIVAKHVGKKRTFGNDSPLISAGLIDSMSIVEIILDLQAAFSVTIPASEVQPDDFDTVERIIGTVARFK